MSNNQITILIIEDERALQIAIEDALAKKGWQIHTARSGEDGFAIAQKEQPDLIVVDIMLVGKITGVDVLRQVRQEGEWGTNVPIIIMTSLSYLDNMKEVQNLASEYLFKGDFELEELSKKIENLLEENHASGHPSPLNNPQPKD